MLMIYHLIKQFKLMKLFKTHSKITKDLHKLIRIIFLIILINNKHLIKQLTKDKNNSLINQ